MDPLLAYHLCITSVCLKMPDIHDSWDTLRQRMRSHMRVTTTMRTKDNKTLHIRKAARPEPWQQASNLSGTGFTSKSRRNTQNNHSWLESNCIS
ncbi:MAG: hypothetical protein IPP22_10470 [Nitrosomonas sp.]|nr:hypothetical protein [Nitrosomonas sp.]